jgi:hypothetical protein
MKIFPVLVLGAHLLVDVACFFSQGEPQRCFEHPLVHQDLIEQERSAYLEKTSKDNHK